jgi:hypothetical protein
MAALMKNQKLSVALAVASIAAGTATFCSVKAQQNTTAAKPATPVLAKNALQNVQVVDLTEPNTIWPRLHLIYDFERNTATLVSINLHNLNDNKPVMTVLEIRSLDKVSPRPKE